MEPAGRPLPRWLTLAGAPAPAVVDGRACRTRAAFFDEAARALRLPSYFGRNWDALADSLRDLTRTGGVALVVAYAGDLLADEPPEQFATLLDVLAVAAEAGLTLTLCADPADAAALRRRIAAALA